MDDAFYWIGVAVVAVAALAAALYALAWMYFRGVHGRIGAILFRKGERRLSLTSWHPSRLLSDKHYTADDWPINERPFYLSYQIGRRRLFVMAGALEPMRSAAVRGKHPEETTPAHQGDAA